MSGKVVALLAAALLSSSVVSGQVQECFRQEGSRIIIQAEDTLINSANWQVKTDVAGFSGDGYMVYNGPDVVEYEGEHVLRYPIKVTRAGTFYLKMYTTRTADFDCPTEDSCNDVYVLIDGTPNRFFTDHGSDIETWAFGSQFDNGDENVVATLDFARGTHELVIAASNRGYGIDRIVLQEAEDPPVTATMTRKVLCGPDVPTEPEDCSDVPSVLTQNPILLTVTNNKVRDVVIYTVDEEGVKQPETTIPVGGFATFPSYRYAYWVIKEIKADMTLNCIRNFFLTTTSNQRLLFLGGQTPAAGAPVAPAECGPSASVPTGNAVTLRIRNRKVFPLVPFVYNVLGVSRERPRVYPGQTKTFSTTQFRYWVLRRSGGQCFKNFFITKQTGVQKRFYGKTKPNQPVPDPPAFPEEPCGFAVSAPLPANVVTVEITNRKNEVLTVFSVDEAGELTEEGNIAKDETATLETAQYTYWIVKNQNGDCVRSFFVLQHFGTRTVTIGGGSGGSPI